MKIKQRGAIWEWSNVKLKKELKIIRAILQNKGTTALAHKSLEKNIKKN